MSRTRALQVLQPCQHISQERIKTGIGKAPQGQHARRISWKNIELRNAAAARKRCARRDKRRGKRDVSRLGNVEENIDGIFASDLGFNFDRLLLKLCERSVRTEGVICGSLRRRICVQVDTVCAGNSNTILGAEGGTVCEVLASSPELRAIWDL